MHDDADDDDVVEFTPNNKIKYANNVGELIVRLLLLFAKGNNFSAVQCQSGCEIFQLLACRRDII